MKRKYKKVSIKELKVRLKELAPIDIDYEEVKPQQLSDGRSDKES